jgi:hypothetical protein
LYIDILSITLAQRREGESDQQERLRKERRGAMGGAQIRQLHFC